MSVLIIGLNPVSMVKTKVEFGISEMILMSILSPSIFHDAFAWPSFQPKTVTDR